MYQIIEIDGEKWRNHANWLELKVVMREFFRPRSFLSRSVSETKILFLIYLDPFCQRRNQFSEIQNKLT